MKMSSEIQFDAVLKHGEKSRYTIQIKNIGTCKEQFTNNDFTLFDKSIFKIKFLAIDQ